MCLLTFNPPWSVVAFCLLPLAAIGCRSVPSTNQVEDFTIAASGTDIPEISCRSNEIFSTFVFVATPDAPNAFGLGFPKPEFREAPYEASPDDQNNVRFDVCVKDDDTFRLMRIVAYQPSVFMQAGVLDIAPGSTVEGLKEAAFGDPTKLNIRVPFKKYREADRASKSSMYFVARGGNVDGKPIAAFAFASHGTASDMLASAILIKGLIASGDLNAISPCPRGVRPQLKVARMGPITLKTDICELPGTAGTKNSKILQISVQDDSERIAVARRGKVFTVAGPQLATQLRSTTQHHNVCDNLVLNLDDIVYGFTASTLGFGGGACSPPIDGAPPQPASGVDVVRYRVVYGANDVLEGVSASGCSHYFWRCE